MARTIFIGDVHGCLYELRALTNALDLYLGDRLVFLGDLVDKGPDSLGVIRQVRLLLSLYPGSVCIAGNHEEKALRFHEKGREQEAWADQATEGEWSFLRSLMPLHREPEHGAVAVHGGFFPKFFTRFLDGVGEIPAAWHRGGGKRMDGVRSFLRVRHVAATDGAMIGLGSEEQGDPHWSEVYDGREGFAFFGHDPLVGRIRTAKHAMGLDTGCVFGGTLTAAVLRPGDRPADAQIVSVSAARKYAEPLTQVAD